MSNIFTNEELNKHRSIEGELLIIARKNPSPLYEFWKTKRNQFQKRIFEQWAI